MTSRKARWSLALGALAAGVTVALLIGARPPAWMLVLTGSMTLAALYIIARLRSRYDPLDPRFGSCIPPISMPRITDCKSLARPDTGER
jgi:hypothetical protein